MSSKLTLGANIASLKAQRTLAKSGDELRSVFERLSSGMRINRASDDAAGLAIADSLRADARVLNQGVRNLNDGLSMLSIADAAFSSLGGVLGRLSELAEQAANSPLSTAQRTSIQEEADALTAEYNRIIQSTEFNGESVFGREIQLQVGYGTNGIIEGGVTDLGGGIGTGEFSVTTVETSVTNGPSDLALSDVNNDGILDYVQGGVASRFYVGLGNGDGTFGAVTSFLSGTSRYVNTADVDGDGNEDFVGVRNTMGIAWGNGDGTFSSITTLTAPALGGRKSITTDLDADGDQDILVANFNSRSVSVVLNSGGRTFAPNQTYQLSAFGAGFSLQASDLDQDGNLDVVASNDSGYISVFIGNGDGTLQTAVTYNGNEANQRDLEIGDFNGDGLTDVVVANDTNGSVSLLLGNGDGSFQEGTLFAAGNTTGDLLVSDLNYDGNLDVLASDLAGTSATLLLGDGNGSFTNGDAIDLGLTSDAFAVGDINGDGVEDILGGSLASNEIFALIAETTAGLQNQSFTTTTEALTALDYYSDVSSSLSSSHAELGAFQSRIAVAIGATQTRADVLVEAEARIRDADMALEAANLVRQNILQQAAAAVLGQANQQPALALQLLS